MENIKDVINRLRQIRYEDAPIEDIGDSLSSAEDFQSLCLDIAEEAVEREVQAEAVEMRIKELQERKNRLNHTADTLRNIILQAMEIRCEKTIQSPTLTISVSTFKPDLVVVDESLIPSSYFIPQPAKLDKKALKEAVVKDGEIISGTALSNGKISLTIRRR